MLSLLSAMAPSPFGTFPDRMVSAVSENADVRFGDHSFDGICPEGYYRGERPRQKTPTVSERKSKPERLAIFLARLGSLSSASSAHEAIDQIAETSNAVEDEFSGIPYDPGTKGADGRMYPVQTDNMQPADDFPGLRLRSRNHNTFVGDNGAVEIREAFGDRRIVFAKPGADGRLFREQ